jgi:predicted LPLAT superfamily acyltransferase
MALNPPAAEPRNPGPSWGFRFLRLCDRVVPEVLFRPLRSAGTWVAVLAMQRQRGYSRDYLRVILGRPPRWTDVHAHFFEVCEALMLKLRVANGLPYRCVLEPEARDLAGWLESEYPVLFGTFHVGNSDLTGFMLAGQERRRVHLVRLRVGNSHDTDALTARFGDLLRFVWVNEPGELLFALKEAGASGEALALQCDRSERSARSESFNFLGASRVFPFTIYHLSMIFDRPVLLSFGAPDGPNRSIVHASPAFVPKKGEPRAAALARAREHFQAFLRRVEAHLRANPYQWLNFLPL